jgi:hypothetical protein
MTGILVGLQNAEAQRTEAAQLQLRTFQNRYDEEMRNLFPRLTALHKALAEVGLVPETVRVRKTGSHGTFTEADYLVLEISARPTEFRPFKFRTFRGYDAQGQDKDQTALYAKAFKLQDHLSAATSMHVSVNHCSMQVKNEGDTKFVLIECSLLK